MSEIVPDDRVKPLTPPVTVCVLCYGDYPELADRVLGSLARNTPKSEIRLRIGLNAVSKETLEVVDHHLERLPVELRIESETNLFKARMMRRLFWERPWSTDWMIWFDDDSYVYRPDWLAVLSRESQLRPTVAMWGKRLFIRGDNEHRRFVREAPWYRGMELLSGGKPDTWQIHFIAGGYWAMRASWLRELHWPDSRLIHFGDDYMLGEALRQAGATMGSAISGVHVNGSKRRAPAGTPRCHVLR